MNGAIRKRSVTIDGHATSVSLEETFWQALAGLAADRKISINALVSEIDRTRAPGAVNLSSAIRVFVLEENQRLSRLLADTEEKLRESNFQRQQLQKKITFLEELNRDLQQISEHNKKLENQLRRMSEIEVMLARVQGKSGGKSSDAPPE